MGIPCDEATIAARREADRQHYEKLEAEQVAKLDKPPA
jgi:hypothetical protein